MYVVLVEGRCELFVSDQIHARWHGGRAEVLWPSN